MGVLAPLLLGRVLGPEWLAALVPLWILLVGAVVQAVRQTLISIASAYNRPGLTAQSEGVAAIVTVGALWPMVHFFGINGAAIVSVVAYSTSALLLLSGSGPNRAQGRARSPTVTPCPEQPEDRRVAERTPLTVAYVERRPTSGSALQHGAGLRRGVGRLRSPEIEVRRVPFLGRASGP